MSKADPPDFMKDMLSKISRKPEPAQPALPLISPVPDGLCPQPLPLNVACGCISLQDGTRVILMQAATPAGVQFYFMPIELAKRVREILTESISAAETGIVVVPGDR